MTKEWMTINEFKKIANVSIPTINRVKAGILNSDKDYLIDTSSRPHLYHKELLSKFISNYFYQLMCLTDYIIRNKNVDIRSLGTDWAQYLISFDWKVFGTVTYDEPRSTKSCVRNMNSIHRNLTKNHQIDNFFFTTEKNTERGSGYHSHFVIDCNSLEVDEVIRSVEKLCYSNNQHPTIEPYNYRKLGSSYFTKFLGHNEDGYGIL